MTLIAPGFLVDRFWRDGETDQFYDSPEELAAEVAAITRAEIEALIGEGVQYVQLDNPGYGAFLGAHGRERAGDAAFERMVDTDRAAVEGVRRPAGATIGLHVCRGNQSSMWLGEGDYLPVAERLFGTVPVDRFLLEYDDDRAGGFEPLRHVPAAPRHLGPARLTRLSCRRGAVDRAACAGGRRRLGVGTRRRH